MRIPYHQNERYHVIRYLDGEQYFVPAFFARYKEFYYHNYEYLILLFLLL